MRWLRALLAALLVGGGSCYVDDPDPGTGCGFPGSPCPEPPQPG